LGVSFGVKDKEKEGWLEKIKSMSGKGILKIVLPPDCQVSEKRLPLLQAPSALSKNDTAHFQGISGLMDRLTVSEYGVRYFSHFEKIKDKDNFYELEYILYGKKTDRENLEASVLKLVSVRQGLNMIHILSDGKKRQEAETLAAAITGGGSLLPLTAVVTFFVMGVWALAEAMADARSLLDGGKVPLMKTGSDWKLSLENVLKTGAEGRLPDLEKTDPERISQAVFICKLWYAAFIPDDGYNADQYPQGTAGLFVRTMCLYGGYGSCILWKTCIFFFRSVENCRKEPLCCNGKLSFCSLNDNVSGHIPGEYYKRKEACDDALFQEQILF